MNYEYYPRGLQKFVVDIKENPPKLILKSENANVYKNYANVIRPLFMSYMQSNDLNGFFTWITLLRPRELLSVITLFENHLDERWKNALLTGIRDTVEKDRRAFRIILEVLYDTLAVSQLWNIVQLSYNRHQSRVERRIDSEHRESWRSFVMSKDPIDHLSELVRHDESGTIKTMGKFFILEFSTFFREVFFKTLSDANTDFFIREEAVYIRLFDDAPSTERQMMAASVIRNCDLNRVATISNLIYKRMDTHTKKPALWHLVRDVEKRKFATWILRQEMKNFFSGVNQHHERYLYWRKFAGTLEDIVVIGKRQTMVMYFEDVVIIELVGRTAGAGYVYDRKTFNSYFQNKISRMLVSREHGIDADLKREELINPDLVLGKRLIHRGSWQNDFDHWINGNLGWEVDERVIALKERQNH